MTLNSRQEKLLYSIIDQYVKTAEPVGSKPLVDSGKFSVSPATIRNEMAELEKNGLVCQPYTSAGRIPTEAGFRYYLEQKLQSGKLAQADIKRLQKYLNKLNDEQLEIVIKQSAKEVATMVNAAVIAAFGPGQVYFTGISNVFKQPEFYRPDMIINISRVIDHLDQVLLSLLDAIDNTQVFIGSDNPFGEDTGAIISSYQYDDEHKGLFGILGPIRMDYQRNFNIVNYLTKQISHV
ncbi:MAG: hypothetical protein ACKKL5_03095 [Candidatus Komeilibacteria bacterium]